MDSLEGEVKWFNNEIGYGFIHPFLANGEVDETKEYFVHFSNIKAAGFKTLQAKQVVSFDLKDTPKGIQAVEVEIIK